MFYRMRTQHACLILFQRQWYIGLIVLLYIASHVYFYNYNFICIFLTCAEYYNPIYG